jgi:AraC-like DNA-binding protein
MLARSSQPSWAALDPVSALLIELRVQGTFFCSTDLAGPWVMDVPARDFASFHFVVSGDCWLGLTGERTRLLAPGQLALVARSPAHRLGSQQNLRGKSVDWKDEKRLSAAASSLQHPGGGAHTLLICGGLRFAGFATSALVPLLPALIVADRKQTGAGLPRLLEALGAEAQTPRAGSATITARLLEIVTVEAIRAFVESAPAEGGGWLSALRDPQLGRALVAIHDRPEVDWSLDSMAAAAGMSRSVFARRFTECLAMPPKHYLTRVRMYRALESLQHATLSVAELAHRLGYDSEAAFARAFKRHIGISPSAARKLTLG